MIGDGGVLLIDGRRFCPFSCRAEIRGTAEQPERDREEPDHGCMREKHGGVRKRRCPKKNGQHSEQGVSRRNCSAEPAKHRHPSHSCNDSERAGASQPRRDQPSSIRVQRNAHGTENQRCHAESWSSEESRAGRLITVILGRRFVREQMALTLVTTADARLTTRKSSLLLSPPGWNSSNLKPVGSSRSPALVTALMA